MSNKKIKTNDLRINFAQIQFAKIQFVFNYASTISSTPT